MMSTKKPKPLFVATKPPTCPYCGHATYSQGGIHPQCAISQADAPRQGRLQADRRAKAALKLKPSDASAVASSAASTRA